MYLYRARALVLGVLLACLQDFPLSPVRLASAQDQTVNRRVTSIRGSVVDGVTGFAIPNASVALVGGSGAKTANTRTSGDGTFVLAAGDGDSYELIVNADAYLTGGYGRIWPGGPSARLRVSSEGISDLVITLWRTARVSGTIIDETDQPIRDARVQLLRRDAGTGVAAGSYTITSDHQGYYEFKDVRPGRYVAGLIQSYYVGRGPQNPSTQLQAPILEPLGRNSLRRSPRSPTLVYQSTFYPDSADIANAELIVLRPGEHRDNVDLKLEPVRAVRLSGLVVNGSEPLSGAEVHIVRTGNVGIGSSVSVYHAVTASGPDGQFELMVPSGDFELRARYRSLTGAGKPAAPSINKFGFSDIAGETPGLAALSDLNPLLEAAIPLRIDTTDGIEQRLEVLIRPSPSVKGALIFDGPTPHPHGGELSKTSITFQQLDTSAPFVRVSVTADGTFEHPSLPSGTYHVTVTPVAGWPQSAVIGNGYTSTDNVVELHSSVNRVLIRLSNRVASIQGTTTADIGRPHETTTVFVFPADAATDPVSILRGLARFAVARVDRGAFATDRLPEGRYHVVAVADASFPYDWRDAEILTRLRSRAESVIVRNGTTRVSLRTIHVR